MTDTEVGAQATQLAKVNKITVTPRLPVVPPRNWLTNDQATMAPAGAYGPPTAPLYLAGDFLAAGWYVMGHCGLGSATVGGRQAVRAWRTPGVPIAFRPNFGYTTALTQRQAYAVTPGRAYTFMCDFWADGPGYTAKAQLEWYAADGITLVGTPVSDSRAVATAKSWDHRTVTAIAPAGAVIMRPLAWIKNPTGVAVGQNMLTPQAASAEKGTVDGWLGRAPSQRIVAQQTTVNLGSWGIEQRTSAGTSVMQAPPFPSPPGVRVDMVADVNSGPATGNFQYWAAAYDEDMNMLTSSFGSAWGAVANTWVTTRVQQTAVAGQAYRSFGWAAGAGLNAADFSIPLYWDKRACIQYPGSPPNYIDPTTVDEFVAISRAGLYEGDVAAWSAPSTGWAKNLLDAERADVETNTLGTGATFVSGWRTQLSGGSIAQDARPNTGATSIKHSCSNAAGNTLWFYPGTSSTGNSVYVRWPATPGKAYTFMGSAQMLSALSATGSSAEMRMQFVDAAFTLVTNGDVRAFAYPNQNVWQPMWIQTIAPPGSVWLQVLAYGYLLATASPPFEALWDSFAVYEGYVGGWTSPATPAPASVPVRPWAITVVDP